MAAADDVDATEKSTFRCLDAARWVVAAAVMVVIVAVIAYAFKVVLRPGDLSVWVVGGSVAVKRSDTSHPKRRFNASLDGDSLDFSFTLRAVNPSGRVRIYYTNITGTFQARNSSRDVNTFLIPLLDDLSLAQQSTVDSEVEITDYVSDETSQTYYFAKLGNGSRIDDAWLILTGTRIVENYSGHNLTDVTDAVYYCFPLTVGGDQDGDATANDDAVCTDKMPTGIS